MTTGAQLERDIAAAARTSHHVLPELDALLLQISGRLQSGNVQAAKELQLVLFIGVGDRGGTGAARAADDRRQAAPRCEPARGSTANRGYIPHRQGRFVPARPKSDHRHDLLDRIGIAVSAARHRGTFLRDSAQEHRVAKDTRYGLEIRHGPLVGADQREAGQIDQSSR